MSRCRTPPVSSFFFFNDTATTEIYTLSLHDALPIYGGSEVLNAPHSDREWNARAAGNGLQIGASGRGGREASNGNQALVIENDVEQILRPVARKSAKAA